MSFTTIEETLRVKTCSFSNQFSSRPEILDADDPILF